MKPFDPGPRREEVRGLIAPILPGPLVAIVSFSLLHLACVKGTPADLESILQLILPPVITLLGTVTGFYLGAQMRSKKG